MTVSGSIDSSTAVVSSFERDQSGNYTCTATVNSISPFLSDSDPHSEAIIITVGEMANRYNDQLNFHAYI